MGPEYGDAGNVGYDVNRKGVWCRGIVGLAMFVSASLYYVCRKGEGESSVVSSSG
jgi:hypothetical protein